MNQLITYIFLLLSCIITAQSDYGYCIDGEEIVFTFNVTDYKTVTIDNTEVELEIADINIKNVTVAGSFNKWSGKGWKLTRKEKYVYELRKKIKDLNTDSGASFKFLINEKFWVEPPPFASNIEKVNLNDLFVEVYNLELNTAKVQDNGNHTFYLEGHSNANEVYLAGSFNQWKSRDFRLKKKKNRWQITLKLPAGNYQYRFIVDGKWMEDPHNSNRVPNEHNEFNSVISTLRTHYFMVKDADFKEVYLAAEFTNWEHGKIAMVKDGEYWIAQIQLPYGAHQYKYIIDGEWKIDAANKLTEYDASGHLNSVVFIK
ncbi:hypothetical protein BBFL7_01110 [Flavobacteria bacterium BBFL7]|nr:hypothetical protein BBFL7_01110 [Flavobacteria bacterium BBFL7]